MVPLKNLCDLNSANESEGEDTGCYSDSKLQICRAVVTLIPAKVHDGLVALQLTKKCSYFEVLHQVIRRLPLAALHC
ncbi:hypothetical protein P5673_023230 [Acropora cervicornis]|uniref:Uncharacterized protein n=1 Tax=Acropora cervicornis TaxID=6130 RepID=A0AAD9Q5P7_ACRCE|nr:hypothetical protein P5673_023230 [Acropora cervicornis]